MPPRFLQRMQRQSDVLRDVFGDPQNDPPPYPFSPSRAGSSSSSFQYRRNRDLSAYQTRFSTDSSSSYRPANPDTSSLHYEQRSDAGSEATTYNFPPPPGYTPATTPSRESFDITTIPRDSLVLVTAANSYLGLHICSQLLTHGFRVRGTVRDAEKAVSSAKLFRDRFGAGRFTTAVIPDMAAQHAFDIAVRGCAGVVHVASVTVPSADPHEVITPSIAGALNALEAAGKEAGVRRVVFTSCASAAVSCARAQRSVVSGESWNMDDFEEAWASVVSPLEDEEGPFDWSPERTREVARKGEAQRLSKVDAVRASAKMQTEQAVWKWCSSRRPSFVLNTVLPDTLWGAPVAVLPSSTSQPGQGQRREAQHLPPSVRLLQSFLRNEPTAAESGHFVPVASAAALHVAALLLPDVRHERVFAVSVPWTRRQIRGTLERWFPERMLEQSAVGEAMEGGERREGSVRSREHEAMDLTVFKDVERAEELLRRMGREGWGDLEGAIRGAVEGFL